MTATVETTEVREPPRSPPLLMTKLHPPPPREQMVPRDRLVERLDAAPGIKLTVVAAPAGCGKTTLLGRWRDSAAATRPVAWLTLDEGDNDPVVLWSYVLAALRDVSPALELPSSPELLGAARIPDLFLPELVNELTRLGDAALVLDDFHRLSSGPARDGVAWFIDNAPSTFQLVVATRSEPALPLAALRAHGALLELRAEELGFTRAEADALLNDRLELELEPDSVDGLVERTEGWPAGLYLAGLSLQAVDDRDSFVSRFGGESRHVVDFLVDEVLDAHDPATQTLMLRSSILERLSGPLCDAVPLVNLKGNPAFLLSGAKASARAKYTVVIETRTPEAQLPSILANPSTGIVNSKLAAAHGATDAADASTADTAEQWLNSPASAGAGSGSYVLESYSPTSQIVLRAKRTTGE